MDIFTERINEILRNEAIKQSELASSIGIARQCITDYKSGKSFPTIQTLCSLCHALDVSADYLLGLEDDFGARTATTAAPMAESMTAEERKLLEQYRQLPEQLKKLVRQQLDIYTTPSELLPKNTKKV